MLTYSEEILLLALDERTGTIQLLPVQAMRYALAGALLVELAMANRIDTDLRGLQLVDATPTGDALLDDILDRLGAAGTEQTTSDWLSLLAWEIPDLQARITQRLVNKGVLRIETRRVFWLFRSERYRLSDTHALIDRRLRMRTLIDSDEIPDPHEAVIIGLLNACQLFEVIFTPEELDRLRPRIEQLSRLDLIAREVMRAVQEIARVMSSSMSSMTSWM